MSNRIVNTIISILSTQAASIIVTIVALAGKVLQKLYFYGLDDDKCHQLQATKNLLAGNGISTYQVFSSDLGNAIYIPLIKWPPAYSAFMAPFYSIGGNNDFWGSIWLDLIAAAAFVWLGRKIILELSVPIWIANVFTLVIGFFIFDFIQSDSTDLLTLVFFQAATLCILKLFKDTRPRFLLLFLAIFFLFICCLLRYMYIPVVLSIPAFMIFHSFQKKDPLNLKRGKHILIAVSLLLAIFLIGQKLAAGSSVYVYPTEKGFYPENLLKITHFLFCGIANLGAPSVILHKYTGIGYMTITTVISWIHLGVLITVLFLSSRYVWRMRKSLHPFLGIAIFSSMAVLAILAYLSLRYAPIRYSGGHGWTFVEERRYYAVPTCFIQIIIFTFWAYPVMKKWFRKLIVVLISCCVLTALHGAVYTMKRTFAGDFRISQKREIIDLNNCQKIVRRFVEQHPGKNIVCASGDHMFNNFAALWENIPGLYDYKILDTPEKLITTKEVLLFVPIKDWYSSQLQRFLQYPGVTLFDRSGDWSFYILQIYPNKKI